MATPRKPAAKKTTTRRPAAAKKTAPQEPKVTSVYDVPEEEREARLAAYDALKHAGLEIPAELQVVDAWVKEIQKNREAQDKVEREQKDAQDQAVAEANQNGPWYVRNMYPAPFNIRLDRQTESRRIQLKARGVPGDLHPLKDEDLQDPVLRQNLAIGLIEVVPAGEAANIMEKQTTNMAHRVHTPIAMLRNEKDEVYKQGAVKVEAEYNSQGVTVARVDERILKGQLSDKEIGGTRATGGLTRTQGQAAQAAEGEGQATSVVHSGFVPTGGNPAIVQYGPLGDNANARIADDIARRKNIEGPAGGGLGDVRVVIDPVQRT